MANGINKIDRVCKSVLAITEQDFSEAEQIAADQKAYTHPFKNATAKWQNDLGNHNEKVLAALKELQRVIREGEHITRPRGG